MKPRIICGVPYLDSRDIADMAKETHNQCLTAIKKLCRSISEGQTSDEFFIKVASTSKENVHYLISKSGCELLRATTPGYRSPRFISSYLSRFADAEASEERHALMKASASVSDLNVSARLIIAQMQAYGAPPDSIIETLHELYSLVGIEVLAGVGQSLPRWWSSKRIAEHLGVFSISDLPHYQAVHAILNEVLEIRNKHKRIQVLAYGAHLAVSTRYDRHAVDAVAEWLRERGYPEVVVGKNRTFSIWYRD